MTSDQVVLRDGNLAIILRVVFFFPLEVSTPNISLDKRGITRKYHRLSGCFPNLNKQFLQVNQIEDIESQIQLVKKIRRTFSDST